MRNKWKLIIMVMLVTLITFGSNIIYASSVNYLDNKATVDLGKVDNWVYTNDSFGFKLHIPEGWQVQSMEAKNRLFQQGADMMAGDNKNSKAAFDAASNRTLKLLSVYKFPVGTPGVFNPNFSCIAEDISGFPGIKSSADYITAMKYAFSSSQNIKVEIDKEMYSETINGTKFDILETKMNFGYVTIRQKYYVNVMRNYALIFLSVYATSEQLDELTPIMKSYTKFSPGAVNL